jgi:hypothetical protein
MPTFIDAQCDLPMFAAARAAGEKAADACQAKAEAAGWDREAAKVVVMSALGRAGGPLSGEQLVNECIAAGIVPHDTRAFGPVIASLARAGRIEAVGFAVRQKGHGTAGARLWAIANATVGGPTDGR